MSGQKKHSPGSTAVSGSGGTLALDGPTVVHALADGLLPAQYYFRDLDVELPMPWSFLPGVGDTHFVVFVWDDHSDAPVDVLPPLRLDGPLTAADFPYPASIPQAFLLNSARVDLSFRIHVDSPSNPSFDTSQLTALRIDRDAPGVGGTLAPAIFPVDPITLDYLDLNPLVPMEIPGNYRGREEGDEILLYFSAMDALPTGAPSFISPPQVSATGQIFVDVPDTIFRSFPGALFIFCFYRLRDRAGNLNPQFSEVARAGLSVAIPAPTFLRPLFPQTESDPINNPNKWMTCACIPPIWVGVEIRINQGSPPFPAIQDGDLVTMRFQGYRQAPDVDPLPDIVEIQTHVWDGVADASGHSFWIRDVERLIRPLRVTAGGEASYMVSRGGVIIGRSFSMFARFDRVVPSAPPPRYCWIDGNVPEP